MENTFENKENVIGKVYKLTCKDDCVKDCYIGSTINLYSRLHKHKNNSVNPNSEKHHLKVYKKIRECGGWENWQCEVLDELENPTRGQLISLERVYYEENNSVNPNSEKHHLKVYKKIRECGGWENWQCEVLANLRADTAIEKSLISADVKLTSDQMKAKDVRTLKGPRS